MDHDDCWSIKVKDYVVPNFEEIKISRIATSRSSEMKKVGGRDCEKNSWDN
jgi:hypothetical protein